MRIAVSQVVRFGVRMRSTVGEDDRLKIHTRDIFTTTSSRIELMATVSGTTNLRTSGR
jgi:hypothetical protein